MIDSIDFKLIGNSDKRVKIDLNGKNLIITGANGCGKTRLLRQLHSYLQEYFQRKIQPKEQIQSELNKNQQFINSISVSDRNYSYQVQYKASLTKQLERIANENMEISDTNSLFELVNNNQIILRFFEANRLASNIASNGQIESISNVKQAEKSQNYEQDSSNQFEKYLVSYYNYESHVIARENNPEKEQQIGTWFEKVRK